MMDIINKHKMDKELEADLNNPKFNRNTLSPSMVKGLLVSLHAKVLLASIKGTCTFEMIGGFRTDSNFSRRGITSSVVIEYNKTKKECKFLSFTRKTFILNDLSGAYEDIEGARIVRVKTYEDTILNFLA